MNKLIIIIFLVGLSNFTLAAFLDYTVNNNQTKTITDMTPGFVNADDNTIYEANNVTIKGELTIPEGFTLRVYGDLDVTNGKLFVYGNLELYGDASAEINFNTSGNNSGIFFGENSTIAFNGTNQTLDLKGSSAVEFENVYINDPGLEIVGGSYTIGGDVTLGPDITDPGNLNITTPCLIIDSNQALSSSSNQQCLIVESGFSLTINSGVKLNVTGSISNYGSIAAQDAILELSGSANQTVSGSGSINIGELVISNSTSSSKIDIQQVISINESLKLNGGIFTPNGNVTLKSTSPTDYAILKKVESNASVAAGTAGNIGFQKRFGSTSITKNGWWQLGPTLENTALAQWSELAYDHIYHYNEPSAQWAKSTNLPNGVGQTIYLRTSNFTTSAKLLEESGRPNIGPQNIPISSGGSYDGGGWNLVANPYPAPIDWSAVAGWTKTNMDAAFYIWDAAAGDYQEVITGVGNNVIAPGQAFWVKVTTPGSATLIVNEDAKSETRSSIFRKKSADPLLTIEIKDPANHTDKMYVRLKEGATDEFDSEFDAYKMAGDFVVISSLTDAGTELSINSLPLDLMQKTIPLKVTSKQKGTHHLNISRSNLEIQKIVLKDKYLNKTIDLEQQASYQFEITSDAASYGINRFELVIIQEVQFAIDSHIVYANKSASIPVTVSNFKNILASQFSLSWDESLLKLTGVHSFGLPSITEAHFNHTSASSLAFVWDQQDLIPQSLADEDTLFVMQFDVLGSSDLTTNFTFPGSSIASEVIGSDLVTLASAFQLGDILIKTTKTIQGQVKDINEKPVIANVVIDGLDKITTTDATGKYSIELASNLDGNLSVENQDKNNKSGISTLDILMARRHLLAQEVISNPFVKSAADLDGSGTISVLDIALIRQIILGYEDHAIKNKSWRYLSALTESESVLANNPEQSYDFVAVKIGDLNSSWNTENSRLVTSDILQIKPVQVSAGQQVEVPVSINQEETITGLQMTINYDADKLALVKINSSDLQINFHISKPGKAILQWDDQQALGLKYSVDEVLFNLVFAVSGNAGETASVSINSDLTDAIILDEQLNEYLIASSFAEINITEKVYSTVQFGNYPNPVVDYTNIIFDAKEPGRVSIMLYDATGKKLETIIEDAKAGYNSIEWINKNYKAGTYILRMQQGNESHSTRMLIK